MAALEVSLVGQNGVLLTRKIIDYLDYALNGMRFGIFDVVEFDPEFLKHPGYLDLYGTNLLQLSSVNIFAREKPSKFRGFVLIF